MKAPNSTHRTAYERRTGALARLPKVRAPKEGREDGARQASLAVERAALTERVAAGTGYRAVAKGKRSRKREKA